MTIHAPPQQSLNRVAFSATAHAHELPLLRSGMAFGAVVPIALASDTISITIIEIVDNAIILLIPGAMDAGLDDIGFYLALAVALLIAGAAAFPANRWLISRGKGHAVVHRHHEH